MSTISLSEYKSGQHKEGQTLKVMAASGKTYSILKITKVGPVGSQVPKSDRAKKYTSYYIGEDISNFRSTKNAVISFLEKH